MELLEGTFFIRGDGRKFERSIVSELMHVNGMINMYILKLFSIYSSYSVTPLETLLAISQPFSAQHRGATCTTETFADISIGLV